MKERIKKIPIIGSLFIVLAGRFRKWLKPFRGSSQYWIDRYESGGNSGAGSYNELAEFKAVILNGFVENNKITTVVEYGCGDGNQLKLANYPFYLGFDVSPRAISLCKDAFFTDKTKTFKLMSEYAGERAQLTLSLDVIYHLVEDDVFADYMERLFDSSTEFVIIYSSNTDENQLFTPDHITHRKFTNWIERERAQWRLLQYIPNKYPYAGDNTKGSFSDFYIYASDTKSRFDLNV
jgi:SAM-dependent methyltransferase